MVEDLTNPPPPLPAPSPTPPEKQQQHLIQCAMQLLVCVSCQYCIRSILASGACLLRGSANLDSGDKTLYRVSFSQILVSCSFEIKT